MAVFDIATAVLLGVFAARPTQLAQQGHARFGPLGLGGMHLSQVAIGLLGVLVVTGEYGSGMIRASLAACAAAPPDARGQTATFASAAVITSVAASFAYLPFQALLPPRDGLQIPQRLLRRARQARLSQPGGQLGPDPGVSRPREDPSAGEAACRSRHQLTVATRWGLATDAEGSRHQCGLVLALATSPSRRLCSWGSSDCSRIAITSKTAAASPGYKEHETIGCAGRKLPRRPAFHVVRVYEHDRKSSAKQIVCLAAAPRAGVLQAGYDADVIGIAGNPAGDVSILADADNITHVWKAGELVKSPP